MTMTLSSKLKRVSQRLEELDKVEKKFLRYETQFKTSIERGKELLEDMKKKYKLKFLGQILEWDDSLIARLKIDDIVLKAEQDTFKIELFGLSEISNILVEEARIRTMSQYLYRDELLDEIDSFERELNEIDNAFEVTFKTSPMETSLFEEFKTQYRKIIEGLIVLDDKLDKSRRRSLIRNIFTTVLPILFFAMVIYKETFPSSSLFEFSYITLIIVVFISVVIAMRFFGEIKMGFIMLKKDLRLLFLVPGSAAILAVVGSGIDIKTMSITKPWYIVVAYFMFFLWYLLMMIFSKLVGEYKTSKKEEKIGLLKKIFFEMK